ncbi:MAG: AraC family transcriptional regulator [Geminicoccaceae bacterium]
MTGYSKRADYENRLNRVVDHIYNHLEEEVTVERLAEVACLSPYHWHRIYTALRGETIATTVKRLRLQRAADRLANSDGPIKDIAARAGYSALESFGRAFKEAYQQSPADYRTHGSHAKFKAANAAKDTSCFDVAIEVLPAIRCASVAHKGSYMQIDQAMGQLFSNLGTQKLLTLKSRMIGVFFDDPDLVPESELRSIACSPIAEQAELTAPLEVTTLNGGAYAKLRYRGPYADMKEAYRWLFGVWLPESGYEAANAPAFEAYLNNPQQVPPTELLTDIHLPLEV